MESHASSLLSMMERCIDPAQEQEIKENFGVPQRLQQMGHMILGTTVIWTHATNVSGLMNLLLKLSLLALLFAVC